jgi:parallel beta-helix repeat protein
MRRSVICRLRAALARRVAIGAAFAVGGLLLAGAAPGAAPRSVLYVDGATARCSDSDGSGSKGRPFCTIGAAAARVSAGSTVTVAAGIYRERVAVRGSGTAARPIVFTVVPGAVAVVTGGKNGFSLRGCSWVRVNGFTVTHTTEYGISVSDATHVTLSHNRVRYAGRAVDGQAKYGIRLGRVTWSFVIANTVDHNTNSGIALVDGSAENHVKGNRSFDNAKRFERAAAGIRLYDAHANTISRNISHDNEDSGIELDRSDDNLIANNVSYENGDHGLDVTGGSRRTRVLANTIYDNLTAGINVEGGSTYATVANNISVENGIDSPRTASNIRVDAASVLGTSFDYDVVHVDGGHPLLIWNSVAYRSLTAFQTATRQELHGIEADPLWRNRAAGNFQLASRSPAIDSASSRVRNQPRADINGTHRTDDLATPNTGVGPRQYDDRGAFEFHPIGPGTRR